MDDGLDGAFTSTGSTQMMKRSAGLWAGLFVMAACARFAEAAPEQGAGPAPKTVRYAALKVSGDLAESRPAIVLFSAAEETLYELVGRIDKASLDPDVQGVIVRVGELDAGWSKVQEVRQALQRCRKAGKDVICVLDEAGNREYYLACSADKIYMAPAGELMLMGLRIEAIFAKDLLDKIGVEGDFEQVGKYKGGAEPFTRTGPSDAFRESLDSLVQDYYDQMVTGILSSRRQGRRPGGRRALL
jgi:protease-4